MRRIAIINQKGGVGKTTTTANLGAALARLGRRVVIVDMDPQANLTLHLGAELSPEEPTSYDVLLGRSPLGRALRKTTTGGLALLPSHIDLSGAELELASAIGRESLLDDALNEWEAASLAATGRAPADYVIIDCPPSLGLLSINGLAAAHEVIVALQTEFFALQGMTKLVEVLELMRRRLNPELALTGILPCIYDTRLRLAREVLVEVRRYFPQQVFETIIRTNIKLAEAPSHGCTIFEYDPSSSGARDYLNLARELMSLEGRDPDLAQRALPVPRVEQLEAALRELATRHRRRHRSGRPAVRPDSAEPTRTDENLADVELEPQPRAALEAKPASEPEHAALIPALPGAEPSAPPHGDPLAGAQQAPSATALAAPPKVVPEKVGQHLSSKVVPKFVQEEVQTTTGATEEASPEDSHHDDPEMDFEYNIGPFQNENRPHMPSKKRSTREVFGPQR